MEDVKNIETRRERRVHRDSESRAGNERPPIVWGMGSQFNYDQSVIDDIRYQFGWVPYIIANDEVSIPYDNAIKQYWEPTPASEYAQLKRHYKDPFNRGRETDEDFVKRGGLISMRRLKEYEKSEEAYYNEENNHKERVIDNYREATPGDVQMMSHSRVRGRPVF